MKTWKQVERRLERLRLPYRVQDETLVSLDGRTVAVSVQGARDRFASPGHPDSKRQTRCKQRSLTRYGARILKRSGVTSCPSSACESRRELRREARKIVLREREERERERVLRVRRVTARLLGHSWQWVGG